MPWSVPPDLSVLAVAVILSYPITGLAESVRETTRRRVDILVNAPEQSGGACRVRVRVTYDVANTTEQPRQVRQHFPVLTQPWRPPSPAGFRIHLNDKPVEFTVDRVDFAPGATDGGAEHATRKPDTRPAKEQQVAWLRLLDEWTQRDPEMLDRQRLPQSKRVGLSKD